MKESSEKIQKLKEYAEYCNKLREEYFANANKTQKEVPDAT